VSGLGSSASKALTSGISWVAFQAIATIGGIYFIYSRARLVLAPSSRRRPRVADDGERCVG
jgi:hypothetical protein